MDNDLKKYLDRINQKVSLILENQNKETWVSVGWIHDLTGWDNQRMRRARDQGIIKWKKDGTHFLYLLESIPPQFIINQHEKNTDPGNNRNPRFTAVQLQGNI
ncbi:hypothetical protein ACX0G7_09900 [Flavitalea antarctica]